MCTLAAIYIYIQFNNIEHQLINAHLTNKLHSKIFGDFNPIHIMITLLLQSFFLSLLLPTLNFSDIIDRILKWRGANQDI